MILNFLGVRGSTPAPGRDFVRYGGHTSCVVVKHAAASTPNLVLDAGTGLRTLTQLLNGAAFDGSILLSHLHWDHVQGIPFFTAGDREGSRVDVYAPAQDGRTGRDLISQLLSPPAFPITPDGLLGTWSFHTLEPGRLSMDGFVVSAADVTHKGGRTFGYRVESGGVSVAYVPDHFPHGGMSTDLLAMLSGVDVLIHDAQFVEPERQWADAYGHATVLDAVALAERCDVSRLVLFHHGPARTDDELDRITDGVQSAVPLVVARDGLLLDVG